MSRERPYRKEVAHEGDQEDGEGQGRQCGEG